MRPLTQAQSILYKTISVLVILINLALITFVWIVQDDVSSSAVSIFAEVDNVSQVMRNGIARFEPEISNLRRLIGQVETASAEIAQNISEDGIILRLLPETVGESLTTSSQSLRDNFMAVYELLGATTDLLLVLDKIPFVEIPPRGLSTVATLQENMEEIASQVETLNNNISDVRAGAGARISPLTDTAVVLGEKVEQFNSDLIQIDRDLDIIQTSVRKYQRLTPSVIITTGIIFSLLSGWVIYSQLVMISQVQIEKHKKIHDFSENQPPPL